jgi:hypothetical protein
VFSLQIDVYPLLLLLDWLIVEAADQQRATGALDFQLNSKRDCLCFIRPCFNMPKSQGWWSVSKSSSQKIGITHVFQERKVWLFKRLNWHSATNHIYVPEGLFQIWAKKARGARLGVVRHITRVGSCDANLMLLPALLAANHPRHRFDCLHLELFDERGLGPNASVESTLLSRGCLHQ